MSHFTTFTALLSLLSLITLSLTQSCTWSYDRNAANGPSQWHTLCEGAYVKCANTQTQSPINLISDALNENNNGSRFSSKPYSDLAIDYYSQQEVKLLKPEQVLFAEYTEGTFATGALKNVVSERIVFHTPSEHQIDGRQYEMEIQIEHVVKSDENDDEELIILSFLVNGNSGTRNDWLQELIEAGIPDLQTARSVETSPKYILPDDRSYFWYQGTATRPPCQNAKWFVFRRPLEATPAQVNRFASALQVSNRPLQAFNGHEVFWFDRTHSAYAWILVLIIGAFVTLIGVGFIASTVFGVVSRRVFGKNFGDTDEVTTLREDPVAYGSA